MRSLSLPLDISEQSIENVYDVCNQKDMWTIYMAVMLELIVCIQQQYVRYRLDLQTVGNIMLIIFISNGSNLHILIYAQYINLIDHIMTSHC